MITKEQCIEYLGGKACNNPMCKRDWYPLASYDFHHIKLKEENISELLATNITWENLKKELDKCILLCAGCHRMFHFFRIKTLKENGNLQFFGL